MGPCVRRDDGRGFDRQTAETASRSRRDAPEPLQKPFALQRAWGTPGCLHPQPGGNSGEARECSTSDTPGSPGVPARNGFNGFLRALPGDRACCHRRLRTCGLSAPGRADLPSANLTPASRRQDHTTSPYAATSLVRMLVIAHESLNPPCNPVARKTLPRPPHPFPRFVTIMIRPKARPGGEA
jgi:hypothetical protein